MDQIYQLGGFFELWNPVVLLLVVVVGLLYYCLVGAWSVRFADAEPVSARQKQAFYTGLALFYIGQGSPISYIGQHYIFSLHMLQQSILYLIVPIFILGGTPGWLIRPLLKNGIVKGLLSFFTRPLIAIFIFNIMFSVYHMPSIMDGLMRNELSLMAYHLMLFVSAFLMWFPVFCPLKEMDKLSQLKKLAYIFGNGVLLTPACALIIFADQVLYEMYRDVTLPFSYLSPLDDQQLGGVVMKIIQEIVYGTALAYIFFRWYRTERKKDEEEYPQGYEDIESVSTPPNNWNRA